VSYIVLDERDSSFILSWGGYDLIFHY